MVKVLPTGATTMSKVILVNRKDHPCNPVRINADEMLEDDELFVEGEQEKELKEGSVPWLEKQLNDKGITIPEGSKKADLEKLFEDSKESE